MAETHRPKGFKRLRELPVVGRAADWGMDHVASVLYLLAGLCFRFAWVGAGRASAHDDEAVARMARLRGQKAA